MRFHHSLNILLSALIFQGYLAFATHNVEEVSVSQVGNLRRMDPAWSCITTSMCAVSPAGPMGLVLRAEAAEACRKGMGSGLDLNLETGVPMSGPAHSLTFSSSFWGWWWHSWFLKTTGQITSSDVAVKSELETRTTTHQIAKFGWFIERTL